MFFYALKTGRFPFNQKFRNFLEDNWSENCWIFCPVFLKILLNAVPFATGKRQKFKPAKFVVDFKVLTLGPEIS